MNLVINWKSRSWSLKVLVTVIFMMTRESNMTCGGQVGSLRVEGPARRLIKTISSVSVAQSMH